MFSSKNLPIMPTLCSKLAYYAGIMLDALACLLCLKLCRHNRRMPSTCMNNFNYVPITTITVSITDYAFQNLNHTKSAKRLPKNNSHISIATLETKAYEIQPVQLYKFYSYTYIRSSTQ